MTEDNTPGGDQTPEQQPQRGSMRFQDAESATRREPSVAEQRARRKALQEEEEREIAQAAADRKSATKRKILIGSGVTVGLVGLVATYYTVAQPENVQASCTDGNDIVVQNDDYCDEAYVTSHGGHVSGGFMFLPLFMGGGQYRYNYGGTGAVGSRVSGGSFDKPANANVTTKSGKSVQRGGLGISGKSSTGGTGKSGGS
ncbi:hypothetical protein [Amycolatopsis nigrescens]|uniref:hypothetical protein n=1 Tax=Amycolatopsis nigrescens TaxID=381445 RepID=UPI0003718BB5|nr:hypothetical protein [Amycolatopsis nigrescens]